MLENIPIAATRTRAHDLWLFVEEIEHRVANELAMAVASISLASAHSTSGEVKTALAGAARRLRDFANVHQTLQPPRDDGVVDLSEYLRRLCESMAHARLNERGIDLDFIGRCANIAAERCWRVGLIVSELITNSIRHAFANRGGRHHRRDQKLGRHRRMPGFGQRQIRQRCSRRSRRPDHRCAGRRAWRSCGAPVHGKRHDRALVVSRARLSSRTKLPASARKWVSMARMTAAGA